MAGRPSQMSAADGHGPDKAATKASSKTGAPNPLLEVKPSPLNTDIDRIGDRLVIFNDRVELRDRNDRVRQVIRGDDITDVVVHRKFTGASVTVESIDGSTIVAKGLRPDQADEVRNLIQRRTRQAGPVPKDRPRSKVGSTPDEAGADQAPAINGAELLTKLTDLYRAGILTDEEFDDKRSLIAEKAGGSGLAATRH